MLDLPLFDSVHRDLHARLCEIVARVVEPLASGAEEDPDAAARVFIRTLAHEGLLEILVPPRMSVHPRPGLRSLCLARETLAAASGVADAVFAVQGLGSFPILSWGTAAQKSRFLQPLAVGDQIAAFALTEPEAGSDVSAVQTTARSEGSAYVIDGRKTLISNAGIAHVYVVFAAEPRETEQAKPRLSAFIVTSDTPGFRVVRSLPMMAPHPIGELSFENCRVPDENRLGSPGEGLKIALSTLDFFRASVGAAACGMAARALQEARQHTLVRRQFGKRLADFQATQFALADMQTELDVARLLVYRAAWISDQGTARITREASIAKLFATEAAQRIIDRAVQLHGGLGVTRGVVVERLYREIRALRIYEGTSEIQRLVIAKRMLEEVER